jgi:hypothetical protein
MSFLTRVGGVPRGKKRNGLPAYKLNPLPGVDMLPGSKAVEFMPPPTGSPLYNQTWRTNFY